MSPRLLLICVVRDQDVAKLLDNLRDRNISFTKLASTGGFLREGNTTLLIGIEEERREEVRKLIRETCARREEIVESTVPLNEPIGPFVPQRIKVVRGGGVLFEVPILYYEKF
ncbi:MAG TPA: cyclic-di-AMP receptor [Candidatus Atribacteria bacterium]|nr:cyclic-di-AMP receptor [Candidatus Atribacteria bacterium]